MKKVTVALTSREHAKLTAICRQRNITPDQLLEEIVERYVKKQREARP